MRLKAEKLAHSAYPGELQTWGDHLRQRRLELGLRQKDVARRLGVDTGSVWGWERNVRAPYVYHVPAIVAFLGYAPYDPAWSLPERLRKAGEAVGLSQKTLAQALGVDEGTVARWERGRRSPGAALAKRIRSLLRLVSA